MRLVGLIRALGSAARLGGTAVSPASGAVPAIGRGAGPAAALTGKSSYADIAPESQVIVAGNLVKLEFEQKNFAKSLEYLALLKEVSPNQSGMKRWEDDIKAAMSR